MLALLSPRGDCAVCYLGTDPPLAGAQLTGQGEGGGREVNAVAEGKKISAQVRAIQAALGAEKREASSAAAATGTATPLPSISASAGSVPSVDASASAPAAAAAGPGLQVLLSMPAACASVPSSALQGSGWEGSSSDSSSGSGSGSDASSNASSQTASTSSALPCLTLACTLQWRGPPPTAAAQHSTLHLCLHLSTPSWVATRVSLRSQRVPLQELLGGKPREVAFPRRARGGGWRPWGGRPWC